ncbi:MAG TPA: hypothetical protein VJ654_12735 [Noviherbaspirillum sp.]|nr:hypothetical protein [Noviherbaspirillum sp.]
MQRSQKAVFLRSDFVHFNASYRQLSRALSSLEEEAVLQRTGYGIYVKPAIASDLPTVVREVRSRLSGRRIKRHVTVGKTTVLLGYKAAGRRNSQTELDIRKLQTAKAILQRFPMSIIRQKSLDNLDRWERKDVWVSAHDEWRKLMRDGSDAQVIAMMTGEDETANRLRQSPPYTGLLNK